MPASISLAANSGSAAAPQFVSGVSAVEVYTTVTDGKGEPVTGLSVADFWVEEDGQRQNISIFAAGEFPLAVALAIDRSFSMPRERLADAIASARRFIDALRPSDQLTVLAIGSQVETIAPLSADRRAAGDAIARLDPWGTTPLFDATRQALDVIQTASGRRALILISDGDDRYSRTSGSDLVGEARRRDVLIYPIATGRGRPTIFAELAAVTGGRSFAAPDRRTLDAAFTSIARELRHQYLLGYAPTRPADQRGWRTIRVNVRRADVRVRARDGYFVR